MSEALGPKGTSTFQAPSSTNSLLNGMDSSFGALQAGVVDSVVIVTKTGLG